MEALSLLTNDSKVNDYNPKPKKILKSFRQYPSYSTGGVYNRRDTFQLQKNKGHLKHQFIKITVSLSDFAEALEPWGTSIIKEISLNSSSGPIQTLTNHLIESKIALLKDTPLGNKIESGLLKGLTTDGTYTITLPLFWFFSERGEHLATSTHSSEQFSVSLLTGSDELDMSIYATVNSLSFELISMYEEVVSSDMLLIKNPTHATNLFQEDTLDLPIGTTQIRLLLRCPYKVFHLHFLVRDVTGLTDYEITNVRLDGPLGYLLELNKDTNYTLTNDNESCDYTTSFTVKFGDKSDQYNSTEYITFGDSMTPTYATITFDTILYESKLYAMSEYRTVIKTTNGMVSSHG